MRGIRTACAFLAAVCVALAASAQDEEEFAEEAGGAILETRMTFELDRASVRTIVEAIAKETGMQYMATDDALDTDPTVTIHVTQRPVEEVLEFLEDSLDLDVDMGHLRETGVLILTRREPEGHHEEGEEGQEGEEEREEFDPQLDHAGALEIVRSHPTVARLLGGLPGLRIEIEWDADDRRWKGEILLGDQEVGAVELGEFEDGEPRIVKLEVEVERATMGRKPEKRENF